MIMNDYYLFCRGTIKLMFKFTVVEKVEDVFNRDLNGRVGVRQEQTPMTNPNSSSKPKLANSVGIASPEVSSREYAVDYVPDTPITRNNLLLEAQIFQLKQNNTHLEGTMDLL